MWVSKGLKACFEAGGLSSDIAQHSCHPAFPPIDSSQTPSIFSCLLPSTSQTNRAEDAWHVCAMNHIAHTAHRCGHIDGTQTALSRWRSASIWILFLLFYLFFENFIPCIFNHIISCPLTPPRSSLQPTKLHVLFFLLKKIEKKSLKIWDSNLCWPATPEPWPHPGEQPTSLMSSYGIPCFLSLFFPSSGHLRRDVVPASLPSFWDFVCLELVQVLYIFPEFLRSTCCVRKMLFP